MKNLIKLFQKKIWGMAALFLVIPVLLWSQPTMEEIQQSIDDGLEWLVAQQDPAGYWNAYGGELEAGTGLPCTNYVKGLTSLATILPLMRTTSTIKML